jgi:obg-like ATPase 1
LVKIKQYIDENCPGKMIPFSVQYEQEVPEAEKVGGSIVKKIIDSGNEALNLIHYFTCGKDEVKSWTIRNGCKAPQAAGVIHSDMEEGFISAEIMSYEDFVELGSEAEVKKLGKYKMCGKEYVFKDGEIAFFKFNKPTQKKK